MMRRTLTMDWGSLGELEDDDCFFEPCHRLSSVDPPNLSDDGEFEDSRMSFASTASVRSLRPVDSFSSRSLSPVESFAKPSLASYDMWVSEPGDIRERRKRLLQGMGLASNKDMQRIASVKNVGVVPETGNGYVSAVKADSSVANESKRDEEPRTSASTCHSSPSTSHPTPVVLVRSRSDGDFYALSTKAKQREEELIGSVSKQRLKKSSEMVIPRVGVCRYSDAVRISSDVEKKGDLSIPNTDVIQSGHAFDSPLRAKNLDTGKESAVKEDNERGLWNKLRDLQTGKQLTSEEFEKSTGHSPMVDELMRRQNLERNRSDDSKKMQHSSYLSKSFRSSKKKGAAFLKNIKGVATSMSGLNKEHDNSPIDDQKSAKMTSQWIKTRQHGKSYKEFTALHMTQDIQAHKGSIWTIKFSWDANFLATAGEDKVVHVWEVQVFDVAPTRFPDDATPVHPMAGGSSDRPVAELTPMHKKKSRIIRKKSSSIPDYVNVPETVFALSEKPMCTFTGHQDDVLDISWTKSQLLLSSSMDKTVRLWDLQMKTCLKTFEHNDYVTCIQFNPVDDNYFLSGSLDAKLRIWDINDRQVVDWVDLHEMVTAASYTPDGQGAIIGSHQGVCRFYTIHDCKLEYRQKIQMLTKAQAKKLPGFHSHTQTKKITGFQFSPTNPSEVLITSADSRIRIHNGTQLIQKYRGHKNTTSQIAASFSPDGQHVISASEDSQVYIWKVEESGVPSMKKRVTVLGHEHFHCKDVSVAIPWPGSIKNEPPVVEIHSKRHSKRLSHYTVSPANDQDTNGSGRRQLPPIPRRTEKNGEEESDPGIGSESSSFDPGSISSHSWMGSSRFEFGSRHHGGNAVQATAWGSVIVTASLEGDIRVYQNFGLPFKVGRQSNLF